MSPEHLPTDTLPAEPATVPVPRRPGEGQLATGRRAVGRRAGWTIADQAVSSLTNAGVTILAARAVSAPDYGAFALVFSIYTFVQAVSQGIAGQVVIIRYSAADGAGRREGAGHASACAVGLGLLAAAGLAGAGLLLPAPISTACLAAAVVLPFVLLQDMWRTVLICDGRPKAAFVNDAVWAVTQFAVIAAVAVLGRPTLMSFLLAWGLAGAASAVLGVRQSGVRPRLRGTRAWLRSHRDLNVSSTVNALAVLGAAQLSFVLLASAGSIETLGAIRGAQTLLGPLNVIGFALSAFAVPEIVRRPFDRRWFLGAAIAISGVLVVVDLVWGGVLLALPDGVGHMLLGDTWGQAEAALPGMVAFTVAIGASVGASSVLRAIERTDLSLWASLALAPLVVALPVGGVLLTGGGAGTAGTGFFVAALVALPAGWWLLHRGLAARAGRIPDTGRDA